MRSSAKYSQGTPSARVCGHASAHIEPFPMIFLQIIPPLTHLRRIRRKRGASQCILQVSEQRRSSPHGENTSLSVVGFEINVYIFPPSTSLLIPLPLSSPVIFVIFLEIQTRTPSTPERKTRLFSLSLSSLVPSFLPTFGRGFSSMEETSPAAKT